MEGYVIDVRLSGVCLNRCLTYENGYLDEEVNLFLFKLEHQEEDYFEKEENEWMFFFLLKIWTFV